jgi:hypothetical protein
MAEENLNNENPTPDFDPGFDLGKYIENDYVEPATNTNLNTWLKLLRQVLMQV